MSERTYIEVIMVEPMEPPKVIQLKDSLEAMQEAVQGNIEEYMPFPDEVEIICSKQSLCTPKWYKRRFRADPKPLDQRGRNSWLHFLLYRIISATSALVVDLSMAILSMIL